MHLKIQRSQRIGGITASTVLFCLDVRADYTPEERSNIRKYRLGSQVIYNSRAAQKHLETVDSQLARTGSSSVREQMAGLGRGVVSLALSKMSLNISIDSLGRGHHIECKDLEELIEAEETVRSACKNVTRYLEVASTFDGSEVVIAYENGEEKVHVTGAAQALLTQAPASSEPAALDEPSATASPGESVPTYRDTGYELGQRVREFWDNPQYRKFTLYGGGILLLFLLVRSCT